MRSNKTEFMARMGILFALAVTLSWLESIIPSPGLPGIKMGLSNIVIQYCLFYAGPPAALLLAVLKSLFVLLTRGATASLLSIAGGLGSVGIMILLSRGKASRGFISVAGAVTHNVGQLAVAALLLKSTLAFWYLPLLIISGIVMGLITSVLLRTVLPLLQHDQPNKETKNSSVKK